MFGLFKRGKSSQGRIYNYDPNLVTVYYNGEVISPEYEAYSLNRVELNKQEFPWHELYPHGKGKIVYSYDGRVVEQYEGGFESGQYCGLGMLIDEHGEVHDGIFRENKLVKKSTKTLR